MYDWTKLDNWVDNWVRVVQPRWTGAPRRSKECLGVERGYTYMRPKVVTAEQEESVKEYGYYVSDDLYMPPPKDELRGWYFERHIRRAPHYTVVKGVYIEYPRFTKERRAQKLRMSVATMEGRIEEAMRHMAGKVRHYG